MIQKITPFLWFDRNCEEAVNFYVSVFKNSKIIATQHYPEGISEGPMAGFDGKILTTIFELEGQRFMALDGGPMFRPTEAISLLIDCETQEEIDYYWDKLSEGGDPNAQQCGWLKDKYGFSWQVCPKMDKWMKDAENKEASARSMQAMMGMKKIIIADLDKAYRGE